MWADPDPHYDNVTLFAPLLADFNSYAQMVHGPYEAVEA